MRKLIIFLLTIFFIIFFIFISATSIYKTDYIDIIKKECEKYGTNPYEILAIIKTESDFNANAVSKKNAIGLMQITLDTANWCLLKMEENPLTEDELYIPENNIKIGVFYYNYLLNRYGNVNSAIAAYNGGMGNVDKWLKNYEYSKDGKEITFTPYKETTRYITKTNNNIIIYKLLYKEL